MTDSTDRLLDFCDASPANSMSRSLRRRLMMDLTSTAAGVIELRQGGETAMVAVLIDLVESSANCAVLELMGARSEFQLEDLLEVALQRSEAIVRQGDRAGIEVPVQPQWPQWRRPLREASYALAYSTYDMATPTRPAPRKLPLPGPDWVWSDTLEQPVERCYGLVKAAMRDVPGAYIGPLDVFAQKLAGKRDDVLLKSGRLAAFVSVSMQGDVGHIDMLGRHPDFRGAGLGRLLLSKGVDRLAEKGASSLALDVTTSNTAALDLYRDFGFTVESTTEVYRKTH